MRFFARTGMLTLLAFFATACENTSRTIDVPPNPTANAGTLPAATLATAASAAGELPTASPTTAPLDAPQTYTLGEADFTAQELTLGSASVAAADFNMDGIPDLVSGEEPELVVFTGDSAGHFTASSRVPGGTQPDYIEPADLDLDGDIDLAIANHDTHYLTLLLGDGNGSFQPAPNSPLQINVSPHPHVVKAIDIDQDGILDLVVDHRDGQGVLVLRGLGGARFETPGVLVYGGGDPYRGFAVGDINRDGKPDLLTPNPREVGVLFNDSTPGQISFTLGDSLPAQAPFAVELADINGDAMPDLISAADEGSVLVQFFIGNGQGHFEQADYSPIQFASGAKTIAVGDFNADGFIDAAVASYQHTQVLVVLGGKESITTSYLPGGEHLWGLAAADFNLDGKDDLLVADDGSRTAALYLSQNNK